MLKRLLVRDGYFRDPDGKPVYLVGANFWPSRTGPWMYRDPWDSNAVRKDFDGLSALGANAVRFFCFLPDFLPAPDVVDEQAQERLAAMIDLAATAGLWSIPTFLVGHMSGENWAPDWSQGKNWYTDPIALAASELLVGTIVTHFSGDARIAAWLLTNEWPLFAGPIDRGDSERWARRLIDVARAADGQCNISCGDGAWDIIVGQTGVPSSPDLRAMVDFFGPHFYPKETDALRHTAFAGFAMRMVQPLGRPVLLEEFGCSSDQVDDELGAAYYRTTLWSAFGAGNCGTLVWNSHDFTCRERAPYSHHPYELHFGLIRTDGSRKPQAEEFARFAKTVALHDPDVWELVPPNAAIGRGAYYTQEFPFDWGWSKPQMRDLFLQAYTSAVQGGVDVRFVELAQARAGEYATLFVPCLWQVTDADVRALERFARDGGTVYLSYGGEPWFPNLGEFIGARLLIRYGLVEEPGADDVKLRFVRDFGDIAAQTSLHFDIRGESRRAAPVRCVPREAAIVACDEHDNPTLLEHRVGAGRVLFLTYPLEYYHVQELESNQESDLGSLYRAIARSGGSQEQGSDHTPGMQTFVWRNKWRKNARRVLFVNHTWEPATVRSHISRGMVDVETGASIGAELSLEAKGVRFLETTPEA